MLREQVGPRRLRFTHDQRIRLAAKAKTLGRRALTDLRTLVTPDTLLAWHRALIARKYDGHPWRRRSASGSSGWLPRILPGATLGFKVHSRTSITRSAAAPSSTSSDSTASDPAPDRQKRTARQEFLRAHWSVLAATDFFTVEIWTGSRLTRFAVLFVIDLATRRIEIAGVVPESDGAWLIQCGRQITDPVEGILEGKRYLLHDRDPLFTDAFRETLGAAGVQAVRLPPHSPNLHAFAERFVRTIKESCLDRLILVGEHSLRRAIREFVTHYHHERNHQGSGNRLLFPIGAQARSDRPITCRPRLGGLLKYYHRPAA